MVHVKKPIIGLALGGGATFGYAHIGVLKALTEEGITVDCIAGTSAGALIGACHAFGMTTDQIITASKELTWRKIADVSFASMGMGLVANKSLAAYVASVIGDVQIEDAPVPLSIVATNIETRQKVVLQEGSLGLALRASTGIPGIFAPTEINDALLVDGGLVENVPVRTLKQYAPRISIGVNLQAHVACYRPRSVFDVLVASMYTLVQHRDASLADHADILIEPDLSAFSPARFNDIEGMIAAGYEATKERMPAIRALLNERSKKTSFWCRLTSHLGA